MLRSRARSEIAASTHARVLPASKQGLTPVLLVLDRMSMSKRLQKLSAVALSLLWLGLMPLMAQTSNDGSRGAHRQETVTIVTASGDRTFLVELANTPGERERGLMFRKRLAEDHGMLFDFEHDEDVHMWMKNTLIPLDMIFIKADGRIRRIEENTEPGSLRPISSGGPVRAVLELNAGTSKKYGIVPGDRVIHRIFSR